MSLHTKPISAKWWRPLEQLGWGIGILAGGLVLLCVWGFALVQRLMGSMIPAPVPPKS